MLKNKMILNKSGWLLNLFSLLLLLTIAWGTELKPMVHDEAWLRLLDQESAKVPASVLHAEELMDLVIARNTSMRALYADWKMSQDDLETITTLPDPTLGLGYFLEPVETAQGPQVAKLSINQNIPWFSKTGAARAGKSSKIDRTLHALAGERLSLFRDVRILWVEAAFLQEARVLLQKKLDLSTDLEEILEVQYKSGSASHKQRLEIRIVSLELKNRLDDLESRYFRLRVKIGSLLELEGPVSKIFIPDSIDSADLVILSSERIERHPTLLQAEAFTKQAEAQTLAAKAEFIPDIRIGLDYILTNEKMVNGVEVAGTGNNPFILSAGIALPLWSWKAKRAQLRASQWQLKRSQALELSEHNQLSGALELGESILAENLRQIDLLEGQFIPYAEEIVTVLQQDYISQNADAVALTSARQKLLDYQLELNESQYSAQLQRANLAYLRGN